MSNLYQSVQMRDYSWNHFLTKARERDSFRRFDFTKEPTKYLAFGESTYSDHFGPKVNFLAPRSQGPIPIPLKADRVKHLVSTTQQDYDNRTVGTHRVFQKGVLAEDSDKVGKLAVLQNEAPEEILTSIGPIPLIKTCRQLQEWETTYMKDYEYLPPKERLYPFP